MHALDSQTLKSLFSWSTSLWTSRVSSRAPLSSSRLARDVQGYPSVLAESEELSALLLALGEVEPLGLVGEAERLEDERDGVAVRCREFLSVSECPRAARDALQRSRAREADADGGTRRRRWDSRPPT